MKFGKKQDLISQVIKKAENYQFINLLYKKESYKVFYVDLEL